MYSLIKQASLLVILCSLIISCDSLTGEDGIDGVDGKDGISAPVPDFDGFFYRMNNNGTQLDLFIGLKGTWKYRTWDNSGNYVNGDEGSYDWSDSGVIDFNGGEGYGVFKYSVTEGNLILNQQHGTNLFQVSDAERWEELQFTRD